VFPADNSRALHSCPAFFRLLAMNAAAVGSAPAWASWSVEDVSSFISNVLKLPQYSEVFAINEVDGPTLLELDEDMLEVELKIFNAIHRKKIVGHIKLLKGPEVTQQAATPKVVPPPEDEAVPPQQKQLVAPSLTPPMTPVQSPGRAALSGYASVPTMPSGGGYPAGPGGRWQNRGTAKKADAPSRLGTRDSVTVNRRDPRASSPPAFSRASSPPAFGRSSPTKAQALTPPVPGLGRRISASSTGGICFSDGSATGCSTGGSSTTPRRTTTSGAARNGFQTATRPTTSSALRSRSVQQDMPLALVPASSLGCSKRTVSHMGPRGSFGSPTDEKPSLAESSTRTRRSPSRNHAGETYPIPQAVVVRALPMSPRASIGNSKRNIIDHFVTSHGPGVGKYAPNDPNAIGSELRTAPGGVINRDERWNYESQNHPSWLKVVAK